MSETASPRKSSSVKHRSQAFHALSEHRHFVLAAGILLVLFAVWCGWNAFDSSSSPEGEEEFAELDSFDDSRSTALGQPATAESLQLPGPNAEMALPPWNATLPPSPGGSVTDGSLVSFATSQEPSASESHESSPVWFLGAIEPADDVLDLPAWAPAIAPQSDPRHATAVGSQPLLR